MLEPQTDLQKPDTTIKSDIVPVMPIYEQDSCTRAPCFHADSSVQMGDGTLKHVKSIRVGDIVATETGTSKVKYVLQTMCDHEMCDIVNFPSGLCITPWHPIRYENEWVFPSTLGPVRYIYCPYVYSFALESDHTMIVNDTVCVTLGHNMTNGILNHSYFGTSKVIDDLATLDGGRGKTITISSVYINRDETGMVCSIQRPYDFTTP
jgi:hypothetical protein